jgi:hypothetical protein
LTNRTSQWFKISENKGVFVMPKFRSLRPCHTWIKPLACLSRANGGIFSQLLDNEFNFCIVFHRSFYTTMSIQVQQNMYNNYLHHTFF